MSQRHRFRQVRPGPLGVPHLGPHYQRGRHGHAQVQATARSDNFFKNYIFI